MADCGLLTAPDPAIRAHAREEGAAIITKDEDFAIHLLLHGGPAVVWLRLGNTRRAALLARVEADLGRIEVPVLVVAGGDDGVAGAVEPLVAAIPGARGVTLPGRGHMNAVGDRRFMAEVIAFLK